MALQDEHVRATHGFGVPHIHLAIGKIVRRGLQDIDAELLRHIRGELGMGPAGNENEVLIRFAFEDCAHRISKRQFVVDVSHSNGAS